MPAEATNSIGLTRADYAGGKSTLCIGCGHDQITRHIIAATYESGVDPYNVAKTSGIGCSSKTGAYFINKGYGINAVHGRMPSIATGASMANRHLVVLAVSGDGDTSNIGLGQFMHAVRRNTNMTYVVENNGVYGLTKGQFSATSDKGSKVKSGDVNEYNEIDLCQMALDLGCGFVAHSGTLRRTMSVSWPSRFCSTTKIDLQARTNSATSSCSGSARTRQLRVRTPSRASSSRASSTAKLVLPKWIRPISPSPPMTGLGVLRTEPAILRLRRSSTVRYSSSFSV